MDLPCRLTSYFIQKEGLRVELLDYLSPSDGRGSCDLRANDVAHWWTLCSGDPDAVDAATRAHHPRWVSPGVVGKDSASRISLRDPDGHGVLVGRSARDAAEGKD